MSPLRVCSASPARGPARSDVSTKAPPISCCFQVRSDKQIAVKKCRACDTWKFMFKSRRGYKGSMSLWSVGSDVHMLPCFNYAIYSCSLTVQKISSTNHAVVGMNKMCNRLKGHKCMIILLYFEYAIQYNRL